MCHVIIHGGENSKDNFAKEDSQLVTRLIHSTRAYDKYNKLLDFPHIRSVFPAPFIIDFFSLKYENIILSSDMNSLISQLTKDKKGMLANISFDS